MFVPQVNLANILRGEDTGAQVAREIFRPDVHALDVSGHVVSELTHLATENTYPTLGDFLKVAIWVNRSRRHT